MSKHESTSENSSAERPAPQDPKPDAESPNTNPPIPDTTKLPVSKPRSWIVDTTLENLGTSYQIIGVQMPRKE